MTPRGFVNCIPIVIVATDIKSAFERFLVILAVNELTLVHVVEPVVPAFPIHPLGENEVGTIRIINTIFKYL